MQEAKNREQAAWDEYQAGKNKGQKNQNPEKEIKWNVVKEEKTRPNNPGRPEEGIKWNIAKEESTRPEEKTPSSPEQAQTPADASTTENAEAKPKHYAASEELAEQDQNLAKYDEETPPTAETEKPAEATAPAATESASATPETAKKTLLETENESFQAEKERFQAQIVAKQGEINTEIGKYLDDYRRSKTGRYFELPPNIPQGMEKLRSLQSKFDKKFNQEDGKLKKWFNKWVERVGKVDDFLVGSYDTFVGTCQEIGKGLMDSAEKNRRVREEKRRLQMLNVKRAKLGKLSASLA